MVPEINLNPQHLAHTIDPSTLGGPSKTAEPIEFREQLKTHFFTAAYNVC